MKKNSIEKSKPFKVASLDLSQLENEMVADLGEFRNSSSKRIGAVYLLIDCSTSMYNSIEQAKKGAMNYAEDAAINGFNLGLISFACNAVFHCEPINDIEMLRERIHSISANGTTNMTDAITIAVEKIEHLTKNRVICIVTDGYPDNPETTLQAAKLAHQKGIEIMTLGIEGADEAFLRKICTQQNLVKMVSRLQLENGMKSMAQLLIPKK